MRNTSDKSCRENQKLILHSMVYFSPENCAVYEKMWNVMVEPGRPLITNKRAYAFCILGKYGQRHALRICNT